MSISFSWLVTCWLLVSSASALTYTDIAPSALSTTTVPWDTVWIDHHREFMTQLVQNNPQGVVFAASNPQYQPQWGEQNLMDSVNGGVAVLDFDGDGDDDILIVGPTGTQNLLFQNNFDGTTVSFTEVASQNGIADASHDGTGVCFADVDNDGDLDIVILASRTAPRLFIRGPTGYTMIPDAFTNVKKYAPMMSCSFGDLNGDGFQDLVISTGGNLTFNCGGFRVEELFDFIFINDGTGLSWTDESAARGLRDPTIPNFMGWAVNMFDFDVDGDLDIIIATDQCQNGITGNTTFLLIYENNGTGFFTEVSRPAMNDINQGSWMNVVAADFNGDGNLDIFLTNIGDMFIKFITGGVVPPGRQSKPLFGTRPSNPSNPRRFENLYPLHENDTVGTAFGWAGLALDVDNDGDTDIVYYGGLNEKTVFYATNPGVYLQNDGTGNFSYQNSLEKRRHQRRVVRGAAEGDFNGDGFPDIVTFSPVDYTSTFPQVIPTPPLPGKQLNTLNFQPPLGVAFAGTINNLGLMDLFPQTINHSWGLGSIAVEMSSGDSGNNWIRVGLRGTKSARDGIGSIVSVFRCCTSTRWSSYCTHRTGSAQIMPYANGAFMSQGSLIKNFGLRDSGAAHVEVFWPSGNTNMLTVSARRKKPIIIPELACDIKKQLQTMRSFQRCLWRELRRVRKMGVKVPPGYKANMIAGYILYRRRAYGAASASTSTSGSGTGQPKISIAIGVVIGLGGCFLGLVVGVVATRCYTKRSEKTLMQEAELAGGDTF